MEQMPYQSHLESTAQLPPSGTAADWRVELPSLVGDAVSLRELRSSDAPTLFAALSDEQVSKFISPPPATLEGFGRFINWTIRQRQAGHYLCFAVVPHGSDTAVGIFQ